MRWKGITLIILVYLVVFGLIFYLLLPEEENEDSVTVEEVFVDIKKDVKSKFSFKNIRNPFSFISNIKLAKYFLPTSCHIKRDFECVYFSPDKNEGFLIFQFRNVMGKNVNVFNVEVSGDINCSSEINASLRNLDEFYVKLENCTFDGRISKLTLYYHEGTPQLYRPVEGRVVVR